MAYQLFDRQNAYTAQKILIAAAYAGVQVEIPADFKFPADTKKAEFLKKNATGKVPVLETPEGCVSESNAIMRYVASLRPSTNLAGKSFYEQALVDQWVDFIANELEPARNMWVFPIQGTLKFEQTAYDAAKASVKKVMDVLEEYFKTHTFFVGNAVTLADIAFACAAKELFELVFEPKFLKNYVNVARYFDTLVHQAQFSAVIPAFQLCQKEAQAKKGKKEKKKQPAKKAAKKQEAPKKKPAKQKNPLDVLPASKTMDMDGTKRLFSNNPVDVALKEFYANFDAEGYCCYVSNYNYNDENTVSFMTCNLVAGWLQRLESLRKYGMGVVTIAGDKPFEVRGAWVYRGTGVPQEMIDCPDTEYHTLTKVDFNDPESKAHFEQVLGDEESVKGQPLVERRWFK